MIDIRQRRKSRFPAAWAAVISLFVLTGIAIPGEAKADAWKWLTDLIVEDADEPADMQEVSLSALPPNAIVTAPGEVRTIELGRDIIELHPATAITIETARGNVVTVHLLAGTIRAKVAKRKTHTFMVETPYLVASVKGTVFEVSTNGAASAVSVYEGRVGAKAKAGMGGVDVPPGKTGIVAADDKDVSLGKTPKGGAAAAAKMAAGHASASTGAVPINNETDRENGRNGADREGGAAGTPANGSGGGGSSAGAPTGSGGGADGESGEGGDDDGGDDD